MVYTEHFIESFIINMDEIIKTIKVMNEYNRLGKDRVLQAKVTYKCSTLNLKIRVN